MRSTAVLQSRRRLGLQAEGTAGFSGAAAVAEDACARLTRVAHGLLPLHGIDVMRGHGGTILQVSGRRRDATRRATAATGAAGASNKIGFTTQNLSRETFGDMRCRKLDAPAPGAAGTTRPPVATLCDVSPDLGPSRSRRSRVRAHSSPHRPRHATPATNSLSTLDSLQHAALAGPPRDGRAAERYAHLSSPQRPAAKLAPRGQARLWERIATPTQQNATLGYATGTRWKAWGRHATGTQLDANAGYATGQRN